MESNSNGLYIYKYIYIYIYHKHTFIIYSNELEFLSILRLNNIPLYVYVLFCFYEFIHQ
jgi:hypothetical protein